ncbi:SGNH/GDSL hydrolase family protein [Peterkaempfera griseoplana]|uniref:SGNH/GDSL hydrolase family protein n=1 Tax=Peterkaempfera griseoplana TaxID=66896 RepID=UPI0006E25BC6|nr:SGNH/GDSL hydrolase family protein [Peterkaempfera griseoplana]
MTTKDPRTALATLAAAAALLLGAGCSTGGRAAPAPPASASASAAAPTGAAPRAAPTGGGSRAAGPYVALGDSYTSAPQIPRQYGTPVGCARSSRNYPSLVAAALGLPGADFRDVSCSGATIDDLTAPQTTSDGTNPAQLDALSARTRLVTLGIGGNDVGFIQVLTRCVQQGMLHSLGMSGSAGAGATPGDAPCEDSYTSAGRDELRQRVALAGRRLGDAVEQIRLRAPHAQVLVVGYPALVPAAGDGSACTGLLGLAPGDVAFLRSREQQLNDELRRRAEAAGARFVDTWTPSRGHDACTAPSVRWIEPLIPAAEAAPVHPNARGERGMADAVLRVLRGSS